MLLLQTEQENINKYMDDFRKISQISNKMYSRPLIKIKMSPKEADKFYEKIKNFVISPIPFFTMAYHRTIKEIFINTPPHYYLRISSIDYIGKPFLIYHGRESKKSPGLLSSCKIYGEMDVNIDSHSRYIFMDIRPYTSPRKLEYSDISQLKSQGAYDINDNVFLNILASTPLQKKIDDVNSSTDTFIKNLLEKRGIKNSNTEEWEKEYSHYWNFYEKMNGLKDNMVVDEKKFSKVIENLHGISIMEVE